MNLRSTATAVILSAVAALATPALAKSEKSFVRDAIRGDLGEIEAGQLAQEKAASPDIKAFGKTLADDHTQARDEMTNLAQQMKLKVPTKANADATCEMKRLQTMQGAAFDREFVKHMVKDHRKDVKEFQKFSQAGKGPAADLAKKQLPVLQKHLQMAEQLGSSPGEGSAAGAKSRKGATGGGSSGGATGASGSATGSGKMGAGDTGSGQGMGTSGGASGKQPQGSVPSQSPSNDNPGSQEAAPSKQ